MNPFCFVITSFGRKPDLKDLKDKHASGKLDPAQEIDFDQIFDKLIKPAIIAAGMEPLIENAESSFGIIHKSMYEKIILAEFCIADLSNFNPNAYYELGMRYATKPYTTIPIIASTHFPLPFDVGPNRTLTYSVDANFQLCDLDNDLKKLTNALISAKQNRNTDSPLYDLVNGISFNNSVAHEKTDIFREKVRYDDAIKEELAYARRAAASSGVPEKEARIEAISKVIEKHKPLENLESGVVIDMMISFRNIEAFPQMLSFIKSMPRYLFETVMVQEQYAFVLNRIGTKSNPVDAVKIAKAEAALQKVEEMGKASSETYGIWGRIYKDKSDEALKSNDIPTAKVHLENACEYYRKGFEFDPRDAYPGVNYVTCLELLGKTEEAARLVPAVEYAVLSKMKRKKPDYWDYATLMELAVIENRFGTAEMYFNRAKPLAVESWMFDTTIKNVGLILNYRKERGKSIHDLDTLLKKCFG
ncbi:MAG: DUF4071 domain-containing protein [Bacteroidia bacterium]|nr:DUF4071 domain-containing protein [Bacteroidia bacterium]